MKPGQVFDQLFFAEGDDILPALDAAHGIGRLDTSRVIPLKANPEEVNKPSILTHCVDLVLGALLLSEYAISVLHPMLAAAGHIVPTASQTDAKYGLCICEREVDAFDAERSEQA